MMSTIYRCDGCKAFNLAKRDLTRARHLACRRAGLWQPFTGEIARVQVTSLQPPDPKIVNDLIKGWQTNGSPFVWEGPKETMSDLLDFFRTWNVEAQEVSTDLF